MAAPATITLNDYTPEEQVQLIFTTKVRGISICAFFFIMLSNFLFYVVFFSVAGVPFIYPVCDILPAFHDITQFPVVAVFSADCLILILCVIVEVKLTESYIRPKSFVNWIFFYVLLNFFYVFLTPILLLPVVRLLSNSNCFPFKCKLNKFIKAHPIETNDSAANGHNEQPADSDRNEHEPDGAGQSAEPQQHITVTVHPQQGTNTNHCDHDDNDNQQTDEDYDDEYFRLIAVHHWLSRLCSKLMDQATRAKGQQPNNTILYDTLNAGLNAKLSEIMQRDHNDMDKVSCLNKRYSPQQIYQEHVVKRLRRWSFKRKVFLRLYLLGINISLIRLLFFNKTVNFQSEHFALFIAFWIRVGLECVLAVALIWWMKSSAMQQQIATNHTATQYYFSVLMAPEFQCVAKQIFDNVETECLRFCRCWQYQLYGIDTRIILSQCMNPDIACIVFEYLFQAPPDALDQNGELDVDDELWTNIKRIAFNITDENDNETDNDDRNS